MELFTLDGLLRRTEVVDRFESLIWTERYATDGDFELVVSSTDQMRGLLVEGTRLALNKSNRVMTIEEIEDKDDSDGRSLLTVKGPSIESVLDDRVTQWMYSQLDRDNGAWKFHDIPTHIAREIFRILCTPANSANPGDAIPFYVDGTLYPADTIAEYDGIIDYKVDNDTVKKVIEDLAQIYGFGYRMYRGQDDFKLYFNVYTGSDRTTLQTALPPVIFSPSLNTISEVAEVRNITDYKNTAYVFHPKQQLNVAASGFENVSGFDRRVLLVDASSLDSTLTGAALTNAMLQLGKDELSKHKNISAIDGSVPQTSKYVYGRDYNLGDLVEMKTRNGTTQNMRVTEQIFSEDASGEKSYPTLVADVFITPGSWLAYDAGKVWDVATGTWDLPA
jgi:hypothetical protein